MKLKEILFKWYIAYPLLWIFIIILTVYIWKVDYYSFGGELGVRLFIATIVFVAIREGFKLSKKKQDKEKKK